jgi:hypothetical protein
MGSLSRSTVRRIRRRGGLPSPRRRRPPRHRRQRPRRARAGQLVQIDGRHHHWFGTQCPPAVLLGAIDDATGTVLAAHVRPTEDGQGYLQLLQDLVQTYGCP